MVDVPLSEIPQNLRPSGGRDVPLDEIPMGLRVSPANANTPPPPKEKPAFSGSFGNVVRNVPFRDPLKDIGAAAYGLGTSTVGQLGDLGVRIPGSVTGLPFSTPLPSTKEVRGELPKSLTPGPGEEAFVKAGEYAPLAAGGAALLKGGIGAIPKIAKALPSFGAESAERSAKLAESLGSGQMGKNILSRATKAAARRKNVADTLYDIAEDRMNARFQRGDTWQQSPAGQQFFRDIDSMLDTSKGTNVTSDTRKGLNDLVRELQGTQRADGSVAYSTPKVLTTTLRELRDAASGKPKEGFKAIGQQAAGDLANKLSASLAEWEPARQSADAQYAFHTKELYPEGVTPGDFTEERAGAEKSLNLLENRLKQGTIKPEQVSRQIRSALRSPAVTRLVKESDAQQINSELDAIDKIMDREKKVRAIAKTLAKAAAIGIVGGLGVSVGEKVL